MNIYILIEAHTKSCRFRTLEEEEMTIVYA